MKQQIFKIFEKGTVLASFATIDEDNKPWVRYVVTEMGMYDLSIRFTTAVNSRKVKHIQNDPEVHLTCGVTPYLQVQGKAKLSTSKTDRELMWRKDLENYFDGVNDPNYGVIVIEPYRIEYVDSNRNVEVWEK